MPNTLLNYTDISGYIKIGRCISTGDLILMSEVSEPCDTNTDREASYEYLHFDPFLIFNELLADEEVQNMLFRLPECYGRFHKETHPEICFLAEHIFNEFHNKQTHYENSVKGLLLSLLSMITRIFPTENNTNRADSQIQTALLFIHNNYNDKLSVADIAKNCCNMSESHFRRKFCEIMHISPLTYINTLRIHKACQLIYHSEMHINEIAEAVGFTTLSSFNRSFKALCGLSPTQWRKEQGSPVSQIRYTLYRHVL